MFKWLTYCNVCYRQRRLAALEQHLGSDSQMATSPAESNLSSSGGNSSLSSAGTHMELAVASDTAASEGSPEGDDELSDGGTPTGDLRVHGPLGGAAQLQRHRATCGAAGYIGCLAPAVWGSWKSRKSHTPLNRGLSGFRPCWLPLETR